ncbi:MAG: flavin reductase [Spirochaetes bacterium]|nr:flavin reductase [Spirochaetota bacterium]
MEHYDIPVRELAFDFSTIGSRWLVLTAGTFAPRAFNSMTISWGSVGEIWNKPFFQAVVRPSRYTREFLEKGDSFTLCVLPPAYKEAMSLLGSKSGRNGDKIAESGLKAMASRIVAAPCYEEAELVIECRKMYWQDLDPAHFLDPGIEANYPDKDYHRAYFGEIVAASGTDTWRK